MAEAAAPAPPKGAKYSSMQRYWLGKLVVLNSSAVICSPHRVASILLCVPKCNTAAAAATTTLQLYYHHCLHHAAIAFHAPHACLRTLPAEAKLAQRSRKPPCMLALTCEDLPRK